MTEIKNKFTLSIPLWWFAGYMFTLGYIFQGESLGFFEKLGMAFITYFAWPLIFGHQLAVLLK